MTNLKITHDIHTGDAMVKLGEYYVKANNIIFSNDRSCYYDMLHNKGNFIPDPDLRELAQKASRLLDGA